MLQNIHEIFHGKIHKKTHENDDFYRKTFNFDQFCKKNRLAAGPLPGVTLGGGQPPAARCAGAKRRQKTPFFFENALSILLYNTYDIILTKKNVHGQKINVHGH